MMMQGKVVGAVDVGDTMDVAQDMPMYAGRPSMSERDIGSKVALMSCLHPESKSSSEAVLFY